MVSSWFLLVVWSIFDLVLECSLVEKEGLHPIHLMPFRWLPPCQKMTMEMDFSEDLPLPSFHFLGIKFYSLILGVNIIL